MRTVDDYMKLEYTVILEPLPKDEGGGFVARVPDLGIAVDAATPEGALAELETAKRLWFEVALESGYAIPEPGLESYSGRFNLRLPKSIHRSLVLEAEREGVSLNQHVLHLLSRRQTH